MSETLSFPGLGLSLALDRVAFTVFGFSVYWYGIIIAVAFLAAATYVMARCKQFGLDADRLMDVILGSVIFGIVGARLYYVAFSWDSYKDNLLSIFNIRQGGIAMYGSIIGGAVAVLLIGKWRQVKLTPVLDLTVGGVMLAQGIGRWANFVNIEAFGSNTSLPWGMTSPSISAYLTQHKANLSAIGVVIDPAMPVHPTFLYESLWCLLGFVLIALYTKRRRFDGELTLIYLAWYGLGRFFIEGLRTDSLLIGTLRISQLVALACFLVALIALLIIHSRIRREGDPSYLQLYVNTPEGQAILAGEFYEQKSKKSKQSKEPTQKDEIAEAQEPDSGADTQPEPEPQAAQEPETAADDADLR